MKKGLFILTVAVLFFSGAAFALQKRATITATAAYNWSPVASNLTWIDVATGLVTTIPTNVDDAEIIINNATPGAAITLTITGVTVNSLLVNKTGVNNGVFTAIFAGTNTVLNDMNITNATASATPSNLVIRGSYTVTINGNLKIEATGNLSINTAEFTTGAVAPAFVTVRGNVTLGSAAGTNGKTTIGSDASGTAGKTFNLYGDITFNEGGVTNYLNTVFNFLKTGIQKIINNTNAAAIEPVTFERINVGDNVNATTVIFAGSRQDAYVYFLRPASGVSIRAFSVLDLPANYSLNKVPGTARIFDMAAGSKLRIGGYQSAGSYGIAGSNFPANFTYNFNPSSTVEYYGSSANTQTIYNVPVYANLIANNAGGTPAGLLRAKKITTLPINVLTSFNIDVNTDVTLGTANNTNDCAIACTGPLNIAANAGASFTNGGGLYCNASVVAGAGTFTMGNYSYLGIGHPQGISTLGNVTGNIVMTGGRNFVTTGNYTYTGIATQITGDLLTTGLPTTVNNLTTDNPTTVTIAGNLIVNGLCLLARGVFDIGTTKMTSNGTGTINSTGGKMKADAVIFSPAPNNQVPIASATVEMKGSTTAQNLSGNWFVDNTIATLINNNVTGITVEAAPASPLLIATSLEYGKDISNNYITGSTIDTRDNLTLLSRTDAVGTGLPEKAGTANFGNATGNFITGKLSIERFLPSRGVGGTGAWRLLATPVTITSSPTIAEAWREGQSPFTFQNYGTIITGPGTPPGPGGNFGPTYELDYYTQRGSMKWYNGATNAYVEIANTTVTKIANEKGYYVFVRGDRTVPVPVPPATITPNNTTLRIKGLVRTGDQNFTVLPGKYESVGNPFASRIDFRTTVKTTMASDVFTTWNPIFAGVYNVGAFEKYMWDGVNFKIPGTTTIRNYIESGEAIFVENHDPSANGTFTIREADKAAGSSVQSRFGRLPALEIGMFVSTSNVVVDPADTKAVFASGVMVNFNNIYRTEVDNLDVWNINKPNNNLSIKNGSTLLMGERRPYFRSSDTIPLNIANMSTGKFRFDITPVLLSSLTGFNVYLKDAYSNTETAVSLVDVTPYSFEITADVASYAANRFMILVRQSGFETARAAISKKVTPVVPDNLQAIASAAIYPNPVTNGIVNMHVNPKAGTYQVTIQNQLGQLIKTVSIKVQNKNQLLTVNIGNAAKGIYQALITDEDGNKKLVSFVVN